MWESNQELKRKLASITPFYDYSFANDYNMTPLDKNNFNFVDNIHPSNTYNNIVVNDLLSKEKTLGVLLNQNNIEKYLQEDSVQLLDYINKNKDMAEKIKNVKKEDAKIAVRRENAV